MTAKKKSSAARQRENEKRREKRRIAAAIARGEAPPLTQRQIEEQEAERERKLNEQLAILEEQTRNSPTDADRDIDFAYRNMKNPNCEPSMAPSLAAWAWYQYAVADSTKFLDICAKREDAKAKAAGSLTQQRIEDDKRKQFAMLDRIERQLTLDVNDIVDDLMSKFSEDVLLRCKNKHRELWDEFHKKYPS